MDGIILGTHYTWRTPRALGVTRGQIALDGISLARGRYLSRAASPDLPARCRAWALVLPQDAAFSHRTAGDLLGAPVTSPSAPHVALTPRWVLPQWSGLVVHGRRLTAADVTDLDGLRATSGAQTFLDLAPASTRGGSTRTPTSSTATSTGTR